MERDARKRDCDMGHIIRRVVYKRYAVCQVREAGTGGGHDWAVIWDAVRADIMDVMLTWKNPIYVR